MTDSTVRGTLTIELICECKCNCGESCEVNVDVMDFENLQEETIVEAAVEKHGGYSIDENGRVFCEECTRGVIHG